VAGHTLPLDEDLDRIGQSQDLGGEAGVGRRHRVAVGVELDEGGLGDSRRDAAVGPGVDPGQRPQLLLPEHLGRRPLGGPMDPQVPLPLPGEDPGVELRKTCDGGHPEESLAVADDPFDPALLIGPGDIAGMDRKSIMTSKVQERRVELNLRSPSNDDTLEVVVAMAMGDPADLVERPDMAVEEELQRMAWVETDDRIPRPGQDIDEPVDGRLADLPFHPVDLGFLTGQKLKLKVRLTPFLPELHRRLLDRPVAARIAVAAEPIENLNRHERRRLLVPFDDQSLEGRDERRRARFDDLVPPNNPRDGLSSHPHLRGDPAHRQPLDFPEPPYLDPERLVHHPQDKTGRAPWLSRLVS